MAVAADIEERRIRFEARKLAIETYTKIHVDRAAGARLLVASYFRLMFTLSLGTLAAIVTLGSAWGRFGIGDGVLALDTSMRVLAGATIALLIVSAILSANGLRGAAGGSIKFVRDPLPQSGIDISGALRSSHTTEEEIFQHLILAFDDIANSKEMDKISFLPPLLSYIGAILSLVGSAVKYLI